MDRVSIGLKKKKKKKIKKRIRKKTTFKYLR